RLLVDGERRLARGGLHGQRRSGHGRDLTCRRGRRRLRFLLLRFCRRTGGKHGDACRVHRGLVVVHFHRFPLLHPGPHPPPPPAASAGPLLPPAFAWRSAVPPPRVVTIVLASTANFMSWSFTLTVTESAPTAVTVPLTVLVSWAANTAPPPSANAATIAPAST